MTTDRDESIERLLRARSSNAHASDPVRGVRLEPDHCPDTETLAALADDTLTAAARREVEAHIADCHRCQALTTAMVRAETGAATSPHGTAAVVPWWKGGALRWLVPAAAAATAIALWVAIPDQRTPIPAQEPTAETQIATPVPALPEGPERDAAQAPADARAKRQTQDGVAGGDLGRAASIAPPAAAPVESPRNIEESVTLEARGEAARRERRADERVPDQAVADQEVAGGLPPAREASASAKASADRSAERGQPSGVPPAAAPAAGRILGALRAGGVDVVSPNPEIRWRVGPGAMVQYSTDAGATWMLQQTGVSAELIAGSSPAPEVCWLVGRGGLVLRTTDSGRQWQRIASPESIDLTAVAASDALNATVGLADGRRVRTTDGGRTWDPVRE